MASSADFPNPQPTAGSLPILRFPRPTYFFVLSLTGDLCETSSRWRVLDPVSPTGETDAAEGKSREGSLCRFRLCLTKNLHKAPSLDGASADASLPSVSAV